MVHAVGVIVAFCEEHEGGASLGNSAVHLLFQCRVGVGAAAKRRLDGRDRRRRLLVPVDESEQLRVRRAAPERAGMCAARVPPRLVEARQVGAAGLVVISAGGTLHN